MYRVKQLLGGKLSLRNYNAQVGETDAMIKALNKLTGLDMPKLSISFKNQALLNRYVYYLN